jgi:NOL1/NOP2/fmu family ribosome biogenesis protein
MLDLCAAPGGKSTAVRAALPEGSLLFSNEPMRTRSQILAENIQKFGHPDMIVTNNYPRDYRKSKLQFDVILTDVPCSGEGMFRKDDGAISEWSLQNVDTCWHLQREIVSDIWNCLKPGGLLIYSTCTFNAHEDEENIAWICEELGADAIALNDIDEAWNITGNLIGTDIPVYRFLPGKTRGEGIFLAVLRKEGEPEMEKEDKKKKKDKNKDKGKNRGNKGKSQQVPTDWLKSSDYKPIAEDDNFYAIPSRWKAIYEDAARNLKVIHAGIKLGTSKGKDFIPDQSLALSTELNTEAFPQIELSYEDAIRYLRKEAVNLPADTPKGYVLVTYQQMPLGWEKNIGNRANNLYPQEWKIKSSHVPEESCVISKK